LLTYFHLNNNIQVPLDSHSFSFSKVTLLQAELSIVQSQLIHSRLALAGTNQTSQQFVFIPSSYSNTTSGSNNATNLGLLTPPFNPPITEELKLSEEEEESNLIALPQK
jgi:hypothetical protein